MKVSRRFVSLLGGLLALLAAGCGGAARDVVDDARAPAAPLSVREPDPERPARVELPGGGTYEGETRDGKPDGRGICGFADGRRYEGEWHDGKENGGGILTLADGSRYAGGWRGDRSHGRGERTWPDGSSYVGEFALGKFHGQGVYTTGSRKDGTWKEGQYVDRDEDQR